MKSCIASYIIFFWEQCRTICGIFGELFFKYFVDMFLFGSTRTYTIFFMIILWTKMYKWTGVGKKWIHKCKYDVIYAYNIIKHIIKKIYVSMYLLNEDMYMISPGSHQMVMYNGSIRACFTPHVFSTPPWNAFIHVKAKEQNYFSPPPPLSDVSID